MHTHSLNGLGAARYALLRSFRRDGTPVDTPIWFGLDGDALVFRTKVGPKTRRLTTRRDVELTACDHRGRVRPGAKTLAGRATILSGDDAERANHVLHQRYGWQWNIVPLIKVPGVTNVHQDLCVREKLSRARDGGVWPDSVIVRVDVP
ncbi:PPOX class F420-dependent oxidoreductase [Mycobacterium sp. 852002-30065_SCH5024008]|uniref:PPOX class F420-dependent oxidoreductase n=1 Tax=Mycobacterium sp. 852002-30065_SCH5024008 TaxID=1834088 RepID=UPI0007FF317F|nr:PPOX class F420-dependent oxidoreductase [Mycobacterium sp. 852002-30065_SCH5024008]OBB92456.1 PPOX class F420-dependent enzyme [Mycobacterium sp. 852002-30065_SCH5024008]